MYYTENSLFACLGAEDGRRLVTTTSIEFDEQFRQLTVNLCRKRDTKKKSHQLSGGRCRTRDFAQAHTV